MEYLINVKSQDGSEPMKLLCQRNRCLTLMLAIASLIFLNCSLAFSQTSSSLQKNAAAAAKELDVRSFAGLPTQIGSADGYGTAARFYAPFNVWAAGGNIYITDYVNS